MDVVVGRNAVDALPFVLLRPVHLHSELQDREEGQAEGKGGVPEGKVGMWAPRFSDQQLEQTGNSAQDQSEMQTRQY